MSRMDYMQQKLDTISSIGDLNVNLCKLSDICISNQACEMRHVLYADW